MKRKIYKIVKLAKRELSKEFNCIHGAITGLVLGLMFLLALFV